MISKLFGFWSDREKPSIHSVDNSYIKNIIFILRLWIQRFCFIMEVLLQWESSQSRIFTRRSFTAVKSTATVLLLAGSWSFQPAVFLAQLCGYSHGYTIPQQVGQCNSHSLNLQYLNSQETVSEDQGKHFVVHNHFIKRMNFCMMENTIRQDRLWWQNWTKVTNEVAILNFSIMPAPQGLLLTTWKHK